MSQKLQTDILQKDENFKRLAHENEGLKCELDIVDKNLQQEDHHKEGLQQVKI
jgi:hypothetical protein